MWVKQAGAWVDVGTAKPSAADVVVSPLINGADDVQEALTALAYVGAKAHRTTTQAIATDTWTAVALTAENWDTDGFHDNVTNNSRMTIPAGKGGKYRCTAQALFAATAGGWRHVTFRKNGADFTVGFRAITTGVDDFVTTTVDVDLIAGDYIEMWVRQSSGVSVNLNPYTSTHAVALSIEYLGA